MSFPALITPRQTLRRLLPEDARSMFALNGDPDVMRYLPDAPFASVEAAREFLVGYQSVYEADGFARWAAVETTTGEWLGWCGLRRMPEGDVDVGYRYLKPFWGRGFATEAGIASLGYGFHTLGLGRIIARAEPGNGASLRVLAKIGLTFEGREEYLGHAQERWSASRETWKNR